VKSVDTHVVTQSHLVSKSNASVVFTHHQIILINHPEKHSKPKHYKTLNINTLNNKKLFPFEKNTEK
jgi:hypothetical protein